MGRRKVKLSLYQSKNVEREKKLERVKCKANDSQDVIPCKLSRMCMPVFVSCQSEVGNMSVHCVGIVVEGGELNNSVPPGNSVPPEQHTQNDAWDSGESLKDKVYRILCDKALITNLIDWLFRWFKFTLKPPYTVASGNLLLAIWDTSNWTSFVKFGLKTA